MPEASKQSIARTSDESKRTDEAVKKTVRFQLSESRRNQSELQKESRELERQRRALKEERANWQESNEVRAIEEKKKAYGLFSEKGKAFRASEEYQSYLEKRKEFNRRGAELESRIGEVNDKLRQAQAEVENARQAVKQEQQKVYDTKAKAAGGKPEYRRKLAVKQFGTTDRFERAGYILPDGRMLNFAQNDGTRDTDHREILDVFGPAEVPNGTEALNKFLADGNVRVMAEAPGVDIAAKTPPTEQQLRQIRAMVEQLGSEKRRFTIDISTTDGRVAASKEYSGKVDADKVVREIREYYKTGELPAESELARFRYQRAEQADRDAKQNQQRQASRVLAEKAAAFDTLNQFFGLTKNTRLSDAALESLAIRWTKTNGSRADRTKLANETRALVEYLRSEGADMAKAQGLAETLAGEVLDEATYRNTELWNQYPDLHDLTYTVDKNGKAKAELVKRYGSWTEAVAEARRHGVKLRQAEGYRDGNPAEQYEAIVNDTRAVGGVKESAAALFRSAAQEAGVAGAASMESTEWLDVLMNVHDTIKPRMMSRFADAAEYEDAKVELAGRMIGDIMSHPEMTDAEAVFEGILKHNREVAAMAAGNEERAAEVTKGLKSVQQAQRKAFADRMRANSRSQSDEVKSVSRAEQQLNENLETLGAQVSTAAGLDEKLTALREAYDREWKAEKKRMKLARQEMLDEIKLERQQLRSQINDLSRQVAGEQQRADRAERQLIFQENDMEDFFGRYTTNLINETSMKLLGYDRATVKNYYPIAVDRSTLATEIEGVKMDATIEGRGFLKERVKSDKPILLEECQNVVKRSLRDTAAYAGLAAPIRDVQRVLNSTVETAEGIGVLKDKIIGEKWGKETVNYITDLLTDLQTTRRKRSSTMSRALDRMRGNYAGAILTVNPGVAIAQAASLPTAGAVLGADTMAAVLPFVKNFSGKQRAAVEAEIRQHGDALLQYRLRGTKRGEMSSIGAHKNLVAKASEAMPAVTGWITGMDEITVAALWEGAKRYVEHHTAEFSEGAAEKGSEAYWEAVNKMYQRVIEETQPNYTTMQRAGILGRARAGGPCKGVKKMKDSICTVIGLIGGTIAALFGGWDTALQTLVIFMAIDYITGLVVAGVFHASPKTKTGALESKAGWKGLIRKGETLLIVLVACQLDAVIGGSFVRDAAIIGFSANEAISIVENAGLMGLPIPAAITKAIDILKQRAETPEKGKN